MIPQGSELPDPPEGGEDAENSATESDVEDMITANAESFVAEEAEQVRQVREVLAGIEMDTFHSSDLNTAQEEVVINAAEVIQGPPDHPALAAPNAAVEAAMDNIRAQPDSRQQWNTQKFIALFSGVGGIAGAVAAIYTIIKAETTGSNSGDVPLDDPTKKKVRDLVAKWWSRSDTAYWGDLATAADSAELALTLPEQILFMNYTIDLSPVTVWIWRSDQDVRTVVDQLRAAYATSGSKTSAMYRLAPTLTYLNTSTNTNVPLPRPVAANVLRYALSIILVNPTLPPL